MAEEAPLTVSQLEVWEASIHAIVAGLRLAAMSTEGSASCDATCSIVELGRPLSRRAPSASSTEWVERTRGRRTE
eukprot:8061589-Alexandrium_andersonii.AAC.1